MALRDEPVTDAGLRCPECAYNLSGLSTSRCPECGLEAAVDLAAAGAYLPWFRKKTVGSYLRSVWHVVRQRSLVFAGGSRGMPIRGAISFAAINVTLGAFVPWLALVVVDFRNVDYRGPGGRQLQVEHFQGCYDVIWHRGVKFEFHLHPPRLASVTKDVVGFTCPVMLGTLLLGGSAYLASATGFKLTKGARWPITAYFSATAYWLILSLTCAVGRIGLVVLLFLGHWTPVAKWAVLIPMGVGYLPGACVLVVVVLWMAYLARWCRSAWPPHVRGWSWAPPILTAVTCFLVVVSAVVIPEVWKAIRAGVT